MFIISPSLHSRSKLWLGLFERALYDTVIDTNRIVWYYIKYRVCFPHGARRRETNEVGCSWVIGLMDSWGVLQC
jgi:hypothetical protein